MKTKYQVKDGNEFSEITLKDGRKVQYEEVRRRFIEHDCGWPDSPPCQICSDYSEVMN